MEAIERMKLRQIEAFRAIMLTGSMTTAARQLHTSQPQISRLVSQLEALTQFPLFVRNGSRLRPTLDGERFYEEVEKTFAGIASLESAAAVIRSFGRDRLTVAAMPRLAGGLLARAVARFKLEYPDVTVSIQSGNEATVNEWIRSGMCSTGLAMLYGQTPDLRVEPVITTNCVAVFPRGHRFATLERIDPLDFMDEPYIAFPLGSPMRARTDRIFDEAGVRRTIVAEASLGSSICALVGAGMGVGLINPLAAREEATLTDIGSRPFNGSLPVVIGLLFPTYQARSRVVSRFVECAREVMLDELSPLCEP